MSTHFINCNQSDLFTILNTGYYVTMIDGARIAWLLGPFNDHNSALMKVDQAREKAIEMNGFYHFCAFGTSKLTARELPAGKLNYIIL